MPNNDKMKEMNILTPNIASSISLPIMEFCGSTCFKNYLIYLILNFINHSLFKLVLLIFSNLYTVVAYSVTG